MNTLTSGGGGSVSNFGTLRKGIKSKRLELVDVFLNNKDKNLRATLLAAIETSRRSRLIKDLFIHIVFFIVFVAIILLQLNPDSVFKINDSIKQSLIYDEIPDIEFAKDYEGINNAGDFQDYILNKFAPSLMDMRFETMNETASMNNIMGSTIRVRTMRVREDSCHFTNHLGIPCYSNSYTKSTKDRSAYGIAPGNATGAPYEPPYQYTSNTGGSYVFGYNQYVWDRSGYYLDIPLINATSGVNVTEYFQNLFDNGFFDVQVRAVIISFITLNVNYEARATANYFLTEWTAAGEVNAYYSLRTYRIDMYLNSYDRFRAFLEVVFLLFLFYYIYYFLNEGRIDYRLNRIRYYLSSFQNIVDLINLTLFIVSVILYVIFLAHKDRKLTTEIVENQEYFVNFENLGQTTLILYQISSINILILAFKTFRFLVVHRRLYVLWITISQAKIQLVTFTIMFVIMLMGFLFASWTIFGVQMDSFNGFVTSLGTLLQFIIGNPPDYDEMSYTNRALGPIFYILFTVFMFFILVNMFVAIISNSYEEISDKLDKKQSEKEYSLSRMERYMMPFKLLLRKNIYDVTQLVMFVQEKSPDFISTPKLSQPQASSEIKRIFPNIRDDELRYYTDLLLKVSRARKKYLESLSDAGSEFELRLMGGKSVSFSLSYKEYMKAKDEKKDKVGSLDQKIEHLEKQLDLIMKALNIDPSSLNTSNNNNNNSSSNTIQPIVGNTP